ncbi:unnamed protein product, partial [Lepidochelys kempii]
EQVREPPHGQHPEHRLFGPVLPVQGGPAGRAERVPQRQGRPGGQGPGDPPGMDKLDVKAVEEESARQQEAERRTGALEDALDTLQTKFARLLAELESSAFKLALRIERLEWQTQAWAGASGEGPGAVPGQ